MEKKKKKKTHKSLTPSSDPIEIQPENSYDMVNKYGRCNIQPTGISGNPYPAIGQGLAENTADDIQRERDEWLRKNNEEQGKK